MEAPVKRRQGKRVRFDPPDREWLEEQFLLPPKGLGKTNIVIAHEQGASAHTVIEWKKRVGVKDDLGKRHSYRMSGEGNPAYAKGVSRNYHYKVLIGRREPVCEWCGTTEQLHVHHKDHNTENGSPENLGWLCYHCNLLEAHIYHLVQSDRAQVTIEEGKTIVIAFNKCDREEQSS